MKLKTLCATTLLLFSLSACNFNTNSQDTKDNEFTTVYNLYKSNGGTMTYEEWLDTIKGSDGQNGKDGTSLLTGIGEPSTALGKNGDSYIDMNTWDFYVKEEFGWNKKGNIKGLDGKDGKDGSDGENGKNGSDGENGKDGTDGDDGENGLSAYEIYLKYHPNYFGTEEQWINDLAKGWLTVEKTVYISYYRNVLPEIVNNYPFRTYITDLPTPQLDGFEFVGYYNDGVGNPPTDKPRCYNYAVAESAFIEFNALGICGAFEGNNDSFKYRTIHSNTTRGLIAYVKEYEETISFQEEFNGEPITTLYGDSFNHNTTIKNIYFSKTMSDVSECNFNFYNKALESFIVSDENENFSSENGILYSKSKDKLYCFPYNKLQTTFSIPSTVETIHWYAFYNCSINNIIIPDSVKYLSLDYPWNIGRIYGFKGNLFLERTEKPDTFADNWYGDAKPFYYSEVENLDGQHWHYVNDSPTIWSE